ncbi:hypothetical protein XENTR_v10002655 [Xenopus tropicalis]|nr:hypothetical protein XENTR_v10002655 [Xenopus tropicalis]
MFLVVWFLGCVFNLGILWSDDCYCCFLSNLSLMTPLIYNGIKDLKCISHTGLDFSISATNSSSSFLLET